MPNYKQESILSKVQGWKHDFMVKECIYFFIYWRWHVCNSRRWINNWLGKPNLKSLQSKF